MLCKRQHRGWTHVIDLEQKMLGFRNVPAAAFAAEFIECFPSSKFILQIRNVDS